MVDMVKEFVFNNMGNVVLSDWVANVIVWVGGGALLGRVLTLVMGPYLTRDRIDKMIDKFDVSPIGRKLAAFIDALGVAVSGLLFGKMGKFGQMFEDNVIQYGIPKAWNKLIWSKFNTAMDKDDARKNAVVKK